MKKLGLLFVLATEVTAQDFEVASIHPAVEDHNAFITAENGRHLIHNTVLKRHIATEFGVDGSEMIGGPSWISLDH